MLLLLSLLLFTLNAQGATLSAAKPILTPANGRVRAEIRELINTDGTAKQGLQDYIDGVRCLQKTKGSKTGRNEWDEMSSVHYSNSMINHGYPRFLPWHRNFLLAIETAMSSCLGRSVAVPYWNSGLDASIADGLMHSPLYNFFGGDGSCVFNTTCAIPKKHCLSRKFNTGTTLATTEQIMQMIATSDFTKMYKSLEGFIHGSPHVFLGGDMENMYSSNDPIFYMHHSNVDRIWALWQSLYPASASNYVGVNPVNRQSVTLSDSMSVSYASKYASDKTVSALLSISALGYSYSTGAKVASSAAVSTSRSLQGIQTNQQPQKFKIKHLTPLPNEWVRMNRLDVDRMTTQMHEVNNFTHWLNSKNEYIPRSVGRHTRFRSRTHQEYIDHHKRLIDLVKEYKEVRSLDTEVKGVVTKLSNFWNEKFENN